MNISEIWQALIAGLIQGITELLPVSSSGHVLLFSQLTGVQLAIAEISVLHLGTVASMAIVMRDKLNEYLNRKNWINLAISVIPAGIAGLLFESMIDETLAVPTIIAISLIFWGIVMIFIDFWKQKRTFVTKSIGEISKKQAAVVGLAQMLALIPGTSRSGITTIAGIFCGISPDTAVEFSFLSGMPLIAAAGIYGSIKLLSQSGTEGVTTTGIMLATGVALITGILAAYLYRKLINKRILTYTGIYRILLGIVILLSL